MPYGSNGGMPEKLLMLRQLLGQFSPNYAQVGMLVGLLLVVIYRPERIQLLGMFRVSCVLLAISIVLPSLVGAIVGSFAAAMSGMPRNSSDFTFLFMLMNVLEPGLVAASICLGIFSLLPSLQRAPSRGPAEHPVDS